MKLNKILLIAISLISVCSFISCKNDDDKVENKLLIYSFSELNTIRQMPKDKVITKLENDGWSSEIYVSGSGLSTHKTVNGYKYHIIVDPDCKEIDLYFTTSNPIDIKSIFKAENDFAGNKPNDIKISTDGYYEYYNAKEVFNTSDKSTIINKMIENEWFDHATNDYCLLEFYYNYIYTTIYYYYEDGYYTYGVEICNPY